MKLVEGPAKGDLDSILTHALPAIIDHAIEEYPIEAVGLIWDNGEIGRLRNQANSPNRFAVSGKLISELVASVGERYPVIMYHTHPNVRSTADPSRADVAMMRELDAEGGNSLSLIVARNHAKLWALNGDTPVKVCGFEIEDWDV